jgi:Deoxycytidylate deaminase
MMDYMAIAEVIAKASHCHRRKVGCILVKDGRIVSSGYNAIPKNIRDKCNGEGCGGCNNVIHSELNAIFAAARTGISTNGCDMYITLSPCKECAKGIAMAGIRRVIFKERYRDLSGVYFLRELGVEVIEER